MSTKQKSLGEKIGKAIETQSQRQTRSRNQIANRLSELADQRADFTVEGLWHDLQQTNPHLGRATVFRVVDTLVNEGLLNRIEFTDGSHIYRVCGDEHHHHLACTQCHRVLDINFCIPDEQFEQVGQQADFIIQGHTLTIFGVCADCQESSKSIKES